MNLHLYLRVLSRFRYIVAVGLVVAAAVAFASFAKVSYTQGSLSISYRQQPTWQSTTRLFVTQQGFPWGRSVLPTPSSTPTPTTGKSKPSGVRFADPSWLEGLAVLYAQLINGDRIQRQIRAAAPVGDLVGATAVTDPTTGSLLPLVDVVSRGHLPPAQAARVSKTGAELFRSYIRDQQAGANIPSNQRVLLRVVSTRNTLVAGRKKTFPIVAFLAIMMATVGLAFVLENLRPRVPATEPAALKRTAPEPSSVVTEHTA